MAKYIKNNIRYFREHMGITQNQLGKRIGCDTSQISRYEQGEQEPPLEKVMLMADLFHTTVDELIGRGQMREKKYTEEGVELLDISKAQVVRRQFFSRVNDKAVTISPDGIRFSTACVREWSETEYIFLTVDDKKRLLIIRKSNVNERDSQRWCKKEEDKTVGRKITGRPFSALLYDLMGWSRGYFYKISGYRAINEDDRSEELWFFELDEAEAHPMSEKSRLKAGVKNEDIEKSVLDVLNDVEKCKAEEKARRKELRDAGVDPGPMKSYVITPDRWGQYTFGLPVSEHDDIPSVSLKT